MHKPSSVRDYTVAVLIGAAFTVFLALYLYVRRGFLFDAPPSADLWYVPNKAIAGGGVLMLTLTFLIGPVTRYFDRFDQWLGYRKEIGIVGGFLIFFHGLISFFALPKKFPQEWLIEEIQEEPWGLLGAFLLLFLFLISFRRAIEWIGSGRWWFLQRWGLRLVILFTVLHVGLMKWSGWMRWFAQGGTSTPELANPRMVPASILATLFVAWVILVRLYESVFLFKSAGLTTREISMDPVLRARGRRFFLATFWLMVLGYLVLLTRWI